MEEYIKWLEKEIEVCLEDKDLKREHWAFCQSLKKYRELALSQPPIVGRSEQLVCYKKCGDTQPYNDICLNCGSGINKATK